MRHIFFLILSCALGLCVFLTSEQAQAQSSSGTISIYTYRTVTTRLTNENERLSNVAVTERKNAAAADQRWRRAMLQLEEERASGSASAGRVAQLEKDAADREAEFESSIESLNAQLAAQNDEFQRALRAATAAGTQLLQSEEGQRALELIALGGEESTEAGIQILLAEQEIQDRVDKLRIADRARSIAFTLLGLKGSAPSATTASIINQFDIVIDNDPSRHSDWVELGELYYEAGRLPDAARAARRSLNVAETQRDLAVSYNKIGDVEVAQGNLTGARESYRKSLAIRENLAAADPTSASLQRDLCVSYDRIGNLEIAQGDLTAARESYGKSLAICEKLAATDPSSARLQRNLSISYNRIGMVEVAQGNLTGARESYSKFLAISEKLAAADPSSASLQRDLSVSHNSIGDVEVAQGDLTGARESYSKSLAIREKLAAADPSSASLQRALFVSYWRLAKLGDPEFPWSRVVEKLENMESQGILSPADQHFLDEARGNERMELGVTQ
jgi:tetratricopeptide (TPR) repeat protein